ncbi:hypothetical protein NUACC21_68440 [Scytonema sp. NUACC21]
MRTGKYIKQVEGYSAFIPAPLPPDPPIEMDTELWRILSEADRALGRLDGAASTLPNPNLFVAMYVRQQAVLSSQIVEQFVELGLLQEITGWQRNRIYRYEPYLALFTPLQPATIDEVQRNH